MVQLLRTRSLYSEINSILAYRYIVAICSIASGRLSGELSFDINMAVGCVAHGPATAKRRHVAMNCYRFTTPIRVN